MTISRNGHRQQEKTRNIFNPELATLSKGLQKKITFIEIFCNASNFSSSLK